MTFCEAVRVARAASEAAASLQLAQELAREDETTSARLPSAGTQASLQLAQTLLAEDLRQAEDAERANAEAAALLLAQDLANGADTTRLPSAGTVASLRLAEELRAADIAEREHADAARADAEAAALLLTQELVNKEAEAMRLPSAGTVASLMLAQELRKADEEAIEAARHFDCLVCSDNKAIDGSFTGECGHRTCRECMKNYILSKLDDGQVMDAQGTHWVLTGYSRGTHEVHTAALPGTVNAWHAHSRRIPLAWNPLVRCLRRICAAPTGAAAVR